MGSSNTDAAMPPAFAGFAHRRAPRGSTRTLAQKPWEMMSVSARIERHGRLKPVVSESSEADPYVLSRRLAVHRVDIVQ